MVGDFTFFLDPFVGFFQDYEELCINNQTFGGTVTVAEDENERTFSIVGEDEADPEQGRVSWTSPLAKAVHGARVGDLRIWQRPKGNLELEILEIAEITCP